MNELLNKLIFGRPVDENDIDKALFEICDNVHSSCGYECPVYRLLPSKEGCACFKNGARMRKLIKEKGSAV